MLFPSLKELTKNNQCRYSLVIATAKRARGIAENAEDQGLMLSEKPVKTAIHEIASGRVVYSERNPIN